jgi:hypothetical protein
MNWKNLPLWFVAALLWTTVFVAMAQGPTPLTLGGEVRSVVFQHFFMAPRFENGFQADHDAHANQAIVPLFDSTGGLVRTNEVVLPGAESFYVADVSVSRSGRVAVVARAANREGGYVGTLLLFEQPGPPKLVIRTNPLIGWCVAIAPDGFTWVAGIIPEAEYGQPSPQGGIKTPTPEEMDRLYVLQRYSPEGVLVGSFLKRTNFSLQVRPWFGEKGGTRLRASASRIGLYVSHDDGSGEWIELSLAGDFKGRWAVPAPAKSLGVFTFGFTDGGSVYSEWVLAGRPPGAPGEGTYRLNKATSTWDRLAPIVARTVSGVPPLVGFRPYLIGTDGDLLVFKTSFRPSEIVWFKEPSQQ